LSYQPKTFADVPVAIVRSLSKVHDAGEWTIAVETSGSVE
jgi:hypothetical protein